MSQNLSFIRRYVEEGTGLSLFSSSRDNSYRLARAVYYGLAKKYTTKTLQEIGAEVGRKTHGTVKNALDNTFPLAMQYNMYRLLFENFDGIEVTEYDKLFAKYENLKKEHLSTEASYKVLLKEHNKLLKNTLLEPHEMRYRDLDDTKREVFKQRVKPILISLERT
jgi:hypothetical protein